MEAARRHEPGTAAPFGFAHLLLTHAGLTTAGANYEHQGGVVRVINGAGRFMPEFGFLLKGIAPVLSCPDLVICAGVTQSAVPNSIVRIPESPTILPPGISGVWLDACRRPARS